MVEYITMGFSLVTLLFAADAARSASKTRARADDVYSQVKQVLYVADTAEAEARSAKCAANRADEKLDAALAKLPKSRSKKAAKAEQGK